MIIFNIFPCTYDRINSIKALRVDFICVHASLHMLALSLYNSLHPTPAMYADGESIRNVLETMGMLLMSG